MKINFNIYFTLSTNSTLKQIIVLNGRTKTETSRTENIGDASLNLDQVKLFQIGQNT